MAHSDGYVLADLKPREKPAEFVPFPVEVLPWPVSTYIIEGAEAMGCDPSYIALPILSAAAAAIGNSRRIKLKDSWKEPAIIWTGIVGDSGSMKSPAIDLAMKPLRRMQSEAFRVYESEMEQYQKDLAEYELAVKQRKKKDSLPDKPFEPVAKRYYCGDDAQWLELHRAGTLLVDRKSGVPRTIHIPNASVSVCGGIQPGILEAALGREHFENGLAARLLLAMPPRRAKRWNEVDIDETLRWQIDAVFERLLDMKMIIDESGGLGPMDLPLTVDAQVAWIEFYDEHAAQQAEIAGGDLAAAWSKLEGYAARLALVVHCLRMAAGDENLTTCDYIDADSVAAAVTITRWFGQETRRVYGMLAESDDQREQRRLLELVRSKGGRITVRELMHAGRQYRGSADVAESALKELVDIGWGKWQEAPGGPAGGRPSRMFVLNETGGNKTPAERLE